jgi:hypothetical protein
MSMAGGGGDGGYRQADPTAYGHPADSTSDGAGGADSDGAAVNNTGRAPRLRAGIDARRAVKSDAERVIPYAGIRIGELTGYRVWWIIEGALCSLGHRRLWQPGEVISGDVDDTIRLNGNIWGGVYSFASAEKREEVLLNEMQDRIVGTTRMAGLGISFAMLGPAHEAQAFVTGTIKMWGEVVEHEYGYRAQLSTVRSLDRLYGPGDLEDLRNHYAV